MSEDQLLAQAEREGFLRVSKSGTKVEQHWWNRCEYLDQPFIVMVGRHGGWVTLKADMAPKRSARCWTQEAIDRIRQMMTKAYDGKFYIGPQVMHAYRMPYQAAEGMASALHHLLHDRELYDLHARPAKIIPFRRLA
jgi:hypothetical protein